MHRKNQRHAKLRGRHFNYDLIEDTNVKKRESVEVLLTEYVEGVGRKGEVVTVTPHFAYNKLLLPGLATYVTEANVAKYAKIAEETPDDDKHSSQFANRVSFNFLL